MGDDDPGASRGPDVDIVVTDGTVGEDSAPGPGRVDDGPVDSIRRQADDRIVARRLSRQAVRFDRGGPRIDANVQTGGREHRQS
jgi:hypothetical protein